LATADDTYLENQGMALFLKTAVFLSSRIKYNARQKKYGIEKVNGLDPLHEDPQSNNTLCHVLALWVLTKASTLLANLKPAQANPLKKTFKITKATLDKWHKQAHHLVVPLQNDFLILPFDQFADLPEDQKHFECPEFLLMVYLFGHTESVALLKSLVPTFNAEMLQKNIDYYAKRTLSTATLGQLILTSLQPTARNDFLNSFKHIYTEPPSPCVMGASIDFILHGYVGIRIEPDVVTFTPCLPKDIRSLQCRFQAKGQWFSVDLNHQQLTLLLEPNHKKMIKLKVFQKYHRILAGEQLKVVLPKDPSHIA